jgi:hypothetical protein
VTCFFQSSARGHACQLLHAFMPRRGSCDPRLPSFCVNARYASEVQLFCFRFQHTATKRRVMWTAKRGCFDEPRYVPPVTCLQSWHTANARAMRLRVKTRLATFGFVFRCELCDLPFQSSARRNRAACQAWTCWRRSEAASMRLGMLRMRER